MVLLRTGRNQVFPASPYRPGFRTDDVYFELGLTVVRDQRETPLAFAVAYAIVYDEYMLMPISSIESGESGVYGITVSAGGSERIITTLHSSAVIRMLIDFGMLLTRVTEPEQEAIEVFRQSRLYHNRQFWMHMWAGAGHLFTLLTVDLPEAGMVILNEKMLVELRYQSAHARVEPELDAFDESAARYGHFIGLQLGIDDLRKRALGTIITPQIAVEIFTRSKEKIVFPSWMNEDRR